MSQQRQWAPQHTQHMDITHPIMLLPVSKQHAISMTKKDKIALSIHYTLCIAHITCQAAYLSIFDPVHNAKTFEKGMEFCKGTDSRRPPAGCREVAQNNGLRLHFSSLVPIFCRLWHEWSAELIYGRQSDWPLMGFNRVINGTESIDQNLTNGSVSCS